MHPEYSDLKPNTNKLVALNVYYDNSIRAGFELLKKISEYADLDNNKFLQICTAESLTGGLIMSTLVDIPYLGVFKYGCFGVYDTDAKRTMLGVKVDNVYTHKCAKEMAIGILKNTNATIGISVTGNAMPLNENVEKLGEVFIGIAGYKDNKIIYITRSINACINEDFSLLKNDCEKWFKVIYQNRSVHNPRKDTAFISKMIRHYTVYKSLTLCKEFIEKFNPDIPDFILERKEENLKKNNNTNNHTDIPKNKYNNENLDIICKNSECKCPESKNECNTKKFINMLKNIN